MGGEIVHKELSYQINGILFDVHNEVGRYANEKQVCDYIEKRLKLKDIPYKREYALSAANQVEHYGRHRVDFLIDNKIVLEIKHKNYLVKNDYYQLRRYLQVLNLSLGILVNFREERLHPKRILNGSGKD
ncbi:MAG: GxxExxY protein [Candidatus Magasanikbacteria bacterium]|nr:GxxExxY protein [Candidatus Magasanikbacteria bacterium]